MRSKSNQKVLPKKSPLDLAKDAIAVDAKNRSDEAIKEYNEVVASIKKKYNVIMIHSGKFANGRCETYISFQANPVQINS